MESRWVVKKDGKPMASGRVICDAVDAIDELMKDREKLIELIDSTEYGNGSLVGKNFQQGFIGKIADHLLANGVTFATDTNAGSKWISVEDEKPKRRGEYFISYVFEDCNMRFYGSAFWHDDMETNGYVTGPHFSNEGVNGMKVTHWMEIPKLPKED